MASEGATAFSGEAVGGLSHVWPGAFQGSVTLQICRFHGCQAVDVMVLSPLQAVPAGGSRQMQTITGMTNGMLTRAFAWRCWLLPNELQVIQQPGAFYCHDTKPAGDCG